VNFLVELFEKCSSSDWLWFEDVLSYCNAKLPHALLECGPPMSDDRITQIGLDTLEWLTAIQTSDQGYFLPIGNSGFYSRGKQRARFDQQPIEAYATVSACIGAYDITGDEKWRKEARKAFDWFLGRNDLNLPLYDPRTGGCRDGLHPDRLNQNEGAESTIAFLISLMEISSMEQLGPPPSAEPAQEPAQREALAETP
ncbi:MAG: glycosyl transferase family 1, partial [Desulfobacterales bacterium]|nr:glycosyl transferase family 1 [Desulfobacterales bacterium]